ncbi:major facilitator superfamily domain-containing protein [Plectosphaerella plurivora]|uniref:Major facilitator superfamily domain-containing protein n=1 Tax=Plectosphaerella plurivora TaxID=936078 RepID=A0A9P8VKN9_9PEZI|nr:major facilitator superfamily domain-containing protein [Plectosphaerella plurivora]
MSTSKAAAWAAWLYHESGIAALHHTGRDAMLIILSRTCRMFAFGAVSLTIALFFSELGFSDFRIGLFMTLTLLGDVVLGLVVTLMADGLGRRRVLLAGGLLMAVSGTVFSIFENFWLLLLAAVIGVISAGGGDFGPFRAIEESMLSHITTPKTRAYVLSWYVTSSSLGSAAGTGVAGRFVESLKQREGWSLRQAYHATFWIYIIMGALNMVLAFSMSARCELDTTSSKAAESIEESAQGLLNESDEDSDAQPVAATPAKTPGRFSQISSVTRSVMYKLWFLLVIDSLADGMASQTLTTYFIDRKFDLSKASLGDIMSTALILGTISTVFAGPLARHLGLLNTMVFTHLPSSIAVLLFPAPSGLLLTIVLLYIRMGLNPMDQAPRAAFIAAVVKPDERTAVMGITSTLRTLAMAVGPSVTGALAGGQKFWIAFVAGGALRITYDVGLWAMFVNMKLHTHEAGEPPVVRMRSHSIDEEGAASQVTATDEQPAR